MSFAEVLAELPALSRRQRHELAIRLVELDSNPAEMDEMGACEFSAVLGFAMLDQMEAEESQP
jgi:hypothetical protein